MSNFRAGSSLQYPPKALSSLTLKTIYGPSAADARSVRAFLREEPGLGLEWTQGRLIGQIQRNPSCHGKAASITRRSSSSNDSKAHGGRP